MAEIDKKVSADGKYRAVYDMGNGLIIAIVHINDLMEQNINARTMTVDCFNQLTANIKKRHALESLPLCAIGPEGRIEIVSGHHRVRAARAAGISEMPVILDVSGLTRSQIVAKQLAHNSLVGKDDDGVLRELFNMMDSIDDKIESFVNVDELTGAEDDIKALSLDSKLDFKTVTFLFADGDCQQMDEILDRLEEELPKEVVLASKKDFERMVQAISKAKRRYGIRNGALAFSKMLDEMLK